jgi:hypothetical protein
MSLFEQLVLAVEEARGAATQAADEEQAWAGRLCEGLAVYLEAPSEAIHYLNEGEGEVMVHAGFPRLRDEQGWHAFDVQIATDLQQRHRFVLPLLFQRHHDPRQGNDRHRIKLGADGKVFLMPSQSDNFFDHLFAAMLADLQAPAGREAARKGGVRRLG